MDIVAAVGLKDPLNKDRLGDVDVGGWSYRDSLVLGESQESMDCWIPLGLGGPGMIE